MAPADVNRLLAEADRVVPARWPELEDWLHQRFGREPGLESILFLVGVQDRGTGFTPQLDKGEKQDLIMQGSYVVLSLLGIYEPSGDSSDGGEWSSRVAIPKISVDRQEALLKLGALRYFEQFMDSP